MTKIDYYPDKEVWIIDAYVFCPWTEIDFYILLNLTIAKQTTAKGCLDKYFNELNR